MIFIENNILIRIPLKKNTISWNNISGYRFDFTLIILKSRNKKQLYKNVNVIRTQNTIILQVAEAY